MELIHGTIMQEAIGVQTAFKQLYSNARIEFLDFPVLKSKLSVRGKMIHYGIHFTESVCGFSVD